EPVGRDAALIDPPVPGFPSARFIEDPIPPPIDLVPRGELAPGDQLGGGGRNLDRDPDRDLVHRGLVETRPELGGRLGVARAVQGPVAHHRGSGHLSRSRRVARGYGLGLAWIPTEGKPVNWTGRRASGSIEDSRPRPIGLVNTGQE